jgi:hypothetical protein
LVCVEVVFLLSVNQSVERLNQDVAAKAATIRDLDGKLTAAKVENDRVVQQVRLLPLLSVSALLFLHLS